MADRMLRHIPSGVLYVYQDVFAQRPDFEEIINVEARVIPDPEVRAPRRAKPKAEVVAVDDAMISEEASRGLP